MPELAQRLSNVKVSPSAAMTAKAREMRAKGVNVHQTGLVAPDTRDGPRERLVASPKGMVVVMAPMGTSNTGGKKRKAALV